MAEQPQPGGELNPQGTNIEKLLNADEAAELASIEALKTTDEGMNTLAEWPDLPPPQADTNPLPNPDANPKQNATTPSVLEGLNQLSDEDEIKQPKVDQPPNIAAPEQDQATKDQAFIDDMRTRLRTNGKYTEEEMNEYRAARNREYAREKQLETNSPKVDTKAQEIQDDQTIEQFQHKLDTNGSYTEEEEAQYKAAIGRRDERGQDASYQPYREQAITELKQKIKDGNGTPEDTKRLNELTGKTPETVQTKMDLLYAKMKEKGDMDPKDVAEMLKLQAENQNLFAENMSQKSTAALIDALFNPANNKQRDPLLYTQETMKYIQELVKTAFANEQMISITKKIIEAVQVAMAKAKEWEEKVKAAQSSGNAKELQTSTLEFAKYANQLNMLYDRLAQVDIQFRTAGDNFTKNFAIVRGRLGLAGGFGLWWQITSSSISAWYKGSMQNVQTYLRGTDYIYKNARARAMAAA